MNYTTLLEEVKHYALHFFKTHEETPFLYHNLGHTEAVVKAATQMASFYQLNDRDVFIVLTAAWFHDMGYYTGPAEGHEKTAADMAAVFLRQHGVDEATVTEVQQCIMATCMNGQTPEGLKAQIVTDADLFHWGTDEFSERNKLMRKEAETRLNKKISKEDWQRGTIKLLGAHHYKTSYGQQFLEPKKKENLEKLKAKFEEPPLLANVSTKATTLPEAVTSGKKDNKNRPDKGIETMFRISSGNNQRLSDMADNKAHIMISTTSIILSVILSVLLRKLEDNPHLVIPTMLLLVVCVTTMVFAILATRPNLSNGTFTQEDIDTKRVNLLFFGNFYRMSYDEYANAMNHMMNDRDFLYGSLTKDVYSQGVVLSRKYRLLRKAYDIFMFGIILSVVAFAFATIIFGH